MFLFLHQNMHALNSFPIHFKVSLETITVKPHFTDRPPINTRVALVLILRKVCFVPGERKPLHFNSLYSTRLTRIGGVDCIYK